MKIFYFNQFFNAFEKKKKDEANFIALFWDRWDDFGSKTQFPCRIVSEGQEVELDVNVKILIEGVSFSGAHLNEKLANGWDGVFPIPGEEYISLPSDIDFYAVLIAKFGAREAADAMRTLRDASFLSNIDRDPTIQSLLNSKPFHESLLRESGATKAFQDGWLAFDAQKKSTIGDFELNIPSDTHSAWNVSFRFNSEVLPYDINVIIGPNGVGKSFCLKSLVEYWLKIGSGAPDELEKSKHIPFDRHPNLERLILLSYSPFEEFVIDLQDSGLVNKDVYKYFGFRRRGQDENRVNGIKISRNLPASDSVHSIIECMKEDLAFDYLPNRQPKIETALQVLKEAIDFDEMAIAVKSDLDPELDWTDVDVIDGILRDHLIVDDGDIYIRVSKLLLTHVSVEKLNQLADSAKGILFVKGNQLVELSSGQRLFSYIVVNILGSIRNNSLVIIDEPELFLHPNLEITLISLLKDVLKRFASKAIVATHSLVTVREIPAKCVHVFRIIEGRREVVRPPFETFGCDVQRISSYVFGDRSVSKPFETWIAAKVKEYGSADRFITALNGELNEEMLLRINYEGRQL